MVGVRMMALAGRVRAFLGRRAAERRGQAALQALLLTGAAVILVGVAVLTFAGGIDTPAATGQRCSPHVAPADAAATTTGRPGGGARV